MEKAKEQIDDDIYDAPEDIETEEVDYDCPFAVDNGTKDDCPICGIPWDTHADDCDPEDICLKQKPKFDDTALRDYTRTKLLLIATWQAWYIEILLRKRIEEQIAREEGRADD
jgi:hypothetical protein